MSSIDNGKISATLGSDAASLDVHLFRSAVRDQLVTINTHLKLKLFDS